MYAHIRDQKKCYVGASCRQLWVTAGTQELQKERGILRFPDFSQPSPLCRFHNTTDGKPRRRRRHAPSVLQSRIHPNRPALSQIQLDAHKVSTSTQVSWRCFRTFWYTAESPAARSPRPGQRALSGADGKRGQFFGPTLPLAGNIKPWRYCGASVQLSARPYGSTQWRLTLLLKRVRSKFVLRMSVCPAALLCALISEFLYAAGSSNAARYQRQPTKTCFSNFIAAAMS